MRRCVFCDCELATNDKSIFWCTLACKDNFGENHFGIKKEEYKSRRLTPKETEMLDKAAKQVMEGIQK